MLCGVDAPRLLSPQRIKPCKRRANTSLLCWWIINLKSGTFHDDTSRPEDCALCHQRERKHANYLLLLVLVFLPQGGEQASVFALVGGGGRTLVVLLVLLLIVAALSEHGGRRRPLGVAALFAVVLALVLRVVACNDPVFLKV
jgi:hypothetical protein